MEFDFKFCEPDFEKFAAVIRGDKMPSKVHLFEHEIDEPFQRSLFSELSDFDFDTDAIGRIRQDIEFRYLAGYDCATLWGSFQNNITVRPLAKEERTWAQEGSGVISSRKDFESIDWDKIRPDERIGEVYRVNLKPGMRCVMCSPLWHKVMDVLLGHNNLFMKVIEEPNLVKDIIDAWGEKVYAFYSTYIGENFVGGIFHGDDLGHKTGTLIRPSIIRAMLVPWFKRFSDLAHGKGKIFLLHSCGNIYSLIEDFIEDVGIDAFHSFQDTILPVTEFKRNYGKRIGVLGGVDVDKLARMKEEELRSYLRGILEICMEGGRYAFGSGNSVTDYIPVKNYLIFLEEAKRFSQLLR